MALAILFIYYLTFPNSAAKSGANSSSNLISITYLGAFAAHFGAQIWMTFISGLALYFSLPRHNFGAVQIVLFPKYFLFNAILSFATLVTFIQLKNNFHEDVETLVQVKFDSHAKKCVQLTNRDFLYLSGGLHIELLPHRIDATSVFSSTTYRTDHNEE